MRDDGLLLAGGIDDRRSASSLAAALDGVGVRTGVSQAGALRLWFGDNLYEFDGGPSYVLADPGVESLATLTNEVTTMITALDRVKAKCRFEIYDGDALVSYHHVMWPQAERAQ